jgi:hypothetical protein
MMAPSGGRQGRRWGSGWLVQGTNRAHLLRTALIYASKHTSSLISGRHLLERLVLTSERAGIERIFVEKG